MIRRLVGARAQSLSLELLEDRRVLAATPIITEFMASNSGSLLDGDGQSSDWVEIYNPSASSIDLAGWKLTDNAGNLAKWTFPSTTIDAGDYLVVFASDKTVPDYIDPLGFRHTTYALSAGGEYLGLVDPLGTIVSQLRRDILRSRPMCPTALMVRGSARTLITPPPGPPTIWPRPCCAAW